MAISEWREQLSLVLVSKAFHVTYSDACSGKEAGVVMEASGEDNQALLRCCRPMNNTNVTLTHSSLQRET